MEGSSEKEEDFHSASESDSPSSHGDFEPSPAVLAFQFAVICAILHQRPRSQNGLSGLPFCPVGLPPFPVKKKRERSRPLYTESIPRGTFQNGDARTATSELLQTKTEGASSAKSQKQTRSASKMNASGSENLSYLRASHGRTHQQPFNDTDIEIPAPMEASSSRTHEHPWSAPSMKTFPLPKKPWDTSGVEYLSSVGSHTNESLLESSPLLRRRSKAGLTKGRSSDLFTWYDEEDGSLYSSTKLSTDKDLDRMSFKELQPIRRSVKCDAVQEGEDSISALSPCRDAEVSSSASNGRTLHIDEEGLKGQGVRRIKDMDLNTFQELLFEEYPQEGSISSDNFSKGSSFVLPLLQHGKRQPGFSVANESEDRKIGKQKEMGESHDSAHPNMVLGDGSDLHPSMILGDGSDLQDRRLNTGRDSEGSQAYRMPEEGQLDSVLLWPVGLAVETIAFQVRLIAQAFSLVVIVFNWFNSFACNRVRETLQAKERATEALSQKVAMITNVPPKVTESGSMFLKRGAWGCFAATYVCILLSMLLFPALLLDYVFLSKVVEEPVSVTEPLHFDYTLPHPTAVVLLHSSGGIHRSVGKLSSHSQHARAIPIGHKVHLTVILTLPESDYNRNLGMFQLTAELLSETGQSIKSSSRPCMLRFHSAPIRLLKTFLVSLPSLVGMFTESQTLRVHLMEFEEHQVATNVVRILLQPKAGMPLGQGIPEIYSADVHIESHLPWLKNLMRNWKWTIYIWTGLMLYVVEIIMVLCCCRQALVPKTWVGQNDEATAEQIGTNILEKVHESGSIGKQLPKSQAQTQHLSANEHIPTARAILDRRERKLRLG